ncbi:MAG TPA: serine hydrolase domain-containing protein, partial [Acidobacteriota bacterium]|nr:serine hydrolase domain-containing protein [Acidobacteriota bacterium]
MKPILLPIFSLFFSAGFAAGLADERRLADDPRIRQALHLYEQWVDAKLAYDRIPGGSLGLVVDQELVWARGFGWADVDSQRPASSETLYSICSISKLFTSIAILQLRDAGRLRLDDPVSQYVPEAEIEAADATAPPVTLRALLTHSSGMPRESAHPYWTGPDFPFPDRDQILDGLKEQRMLYPTDRFFQYSNLGMTMLGWVVEAVSGQPFEEYVRERILDPLALKRTTPQMPEAEVGRSLATGYGVLGRERHRRAMPFFQGKGIGPAAGFASSVEDLAKFASWQFRLLGSSGQEVLSPHTLREMHRVHWVDPDWKTTWGLGFVVRQQGEDTVVGHGGSCPGYRSQISLLPRKKVAAIAMFNAMGVSPAPFVEQLTKLTGPLVAKAGEKSSESEPHPPEMEDYSGLYRSDWGELLIVPWEKEIAALYLPTNEIQENLIRLRRQDGDVFRRVRKDSDDL